MIEEYMTAEELRKEINSLTIRLVMQTEFEAEAEQVLRESGELPPALDDELKNREPAILDLIRKHRGYLKKRHRAKPSSLPVAARVALIIAAALVISMASALATVGMVKEGVLKLDIQQYSNRTEVQLVRGGASGDVPEEWTGVFFPSYIPEEYELDFSDAYEAVFRNSERKMLRFIEDTYGATYVVDSENALVSTENVHDVSATVIEKNGYVRVIWSEHNRLFIVYCFCDKETALRIADSVTMLK